MGQYVVFLLQAENRDVPSPAVGMCPEVRPVVQWRLRAAELGDECSAEAVPRGQGQAAGQKERAQARPAGHQRGAQQRPCGKNTTAPKYYYNTTLLYFRTTYEDQREVNVRLHKPFADSSLCAFPLGTARINLEIFLTIISNLYLLYFYRILQIG